MKASHFAILGVIASAAFAACADDSDTVVSVNIAADDSVGFVSAIHVKVTQGSRTPVERDLTMLPTRTIGAAGATQTVLAGGFFERIVLPESWPDGVASVDVECFDEAGELTLDPAPVQVNIKQNETVAVFVTLERPGNPGGEGGASAGAGGAPSDGGVPGNAGGVPSDGGVPGNAGGVPSDGGVPGNAGGAPSAAGGAAAEAGAAPIDSGGTSAAAGASSSEAAGSSAGGSSGSGD